MPFTRTIFSLLFLFLSNYTLSSDTVKVGHSPGYDGHPVPIIFFGDSLSDAGNKYEITQALHDGSQGVINIRALPPNFQGRFSNGPTWADYLSSWLNGQFSTPARALIEADIKLKNQGKKEAFSINISANEGTNWSVGCAMAAKKHFYDFDTQEQWDYVSGGELMPNVHQQLYNYIERHQAFNPQHWVSIQGGANNLWFNTFGSLDETPEIGANQLSQSIELSIRSGAHNILITNLPPMHLSPAFALHSSYAEDYLMRFNSLLKTNATKLSEAHPEVNIVFLDVHQLLIDINKEINERGYYQNSQLDLYFDNNAHSAWNPMTGEVSSHPNRFLYWDGLHPTTSVHKLVAASAYNLIGCIELPKLCIGAYD